MANMHGKSPPERTTAMTRAAVIHPQPCLVLFASLPPAMFAAVITILFRDRLPGRQNRRVSVPPRHSPHVMKFEQSVSHVGIAIY